MTSCLPPICVPGFANCSGDAACETSITSSSGGCYPAPLTSYTLAVGGSRLDVAVGDDGALLVGGSFDVDSDFDPTDAMDLRGPTGVDGSAFISTYTPSGVYVRTLTLDGGSSWIDDVESGPGGTIVAAGTHRGATDFDPGAGERVHDSGGKDEGFVLALSAEGALAWVRTLPTTGQNAGTTVAGIALDSNGNVHATGSFFGAADFDPDHPGGELVTEDSAVMAYAAKFGEDGGFEWVWSPAGECQSSGEGVAVSGNQTWVAAPVNGRCRFDGAGAAMTAADSEGVSVVGLSSPASLGSFGLLERAGWVGQIVTTETAVFVAGSGTRTNDLDPGPGVDQRLLPSGGGYVVKLAADGTFAWAQTLAGFEVNAAAAASADRLLVAASGPWNANEIPPGGALVLVNADSSPGFTLDVGPNRFPRTVALGGGVLAVAGHDTDEGDSKYFINRYAF
jgi:hypothetical protein